MDGEIANGSEQISDGDEHKKETQSGLFRDLLAHLEADTIADQEIIQVLCEDSPLLSQIDSVPAYNTKDLSRIALARSVSYNKDTNVLLTHLQEGHEQGWTSIVLNNGNAALKAGFDHLQLLEHPFSLSSIQPSLSDGLDLSAQLSSLGKPWLIDQTLIGLQRHRDYTSSDTYSENVQRIGLSQAMNNIAACEPHLRRSSLVSLDVNALVTSFAGIGLSGQATAQLAHYAGRSSYCKIFVLNGINHSTTVQEMLVPILWYFLYGREFRITPIVQKMRSYIVEQSGKSYTFYSDDRTQKWWLENPHSSPLKEIFPLIACSYEDYELLIKNHEISLDLQYLKDLYDSYALPNQ